MTISKICVKCKCDKELNCYSKRKVASDGKDSYCKDCRNGISRKFYSDNKNEQLTRVKKYQHENYEELKEYRNKRNNTEEAKEYQATYTRNRRRNDPLYKLQSNIRRNTSEIFRGKKHKKTLELLGCSFEEAKIHLESQFKPGMSWENYGKWHIDHIYPLSKATSTAELEKLCHYSNLQPLWAIDNMKKGAKILSAPILVEY